MEARLSGHGVYRMKYQIVWIPKYRQPYPEFWSAWLEKVYRKEQVVWSPVYFVSTEGLDERRITEYVKWQAHQNSGQSKLELKSATGSARGYLLSI